MAGHVCPALANSREHATFFGSAGPVWSWPAAFVPPHGGARATAIAIFNIFGAVGGFIGPTLLGKLSDASGDYSKAMLVLGAMDLASALMFLGAPRPWSILLGIRVK